MQSPPSSQETMTGHSVQAWLKWSQENAPALGQVNRVRAQAGLPLILTQRLLGPGGSQEAPRIGHPLGQRFLFNASKQKKISA